MAASADGKENEALHDELTSINAIYPDSLTPDPPNFTLQLPNIPVALKLAFPEDYPSTPPSILGSSSSGEALKRGQANEIVDSARDILGELYQPGEPCLFDLIQELESKFENLSTDPGKQEDLKSGNNDEVQEATQQEQEETARFLNLQPPWTLSEPITEKKSVFLARAAPVTSRDEAQRYLSHLLATDKKAAKATHNISAWRIHADGGAVIQDCDDDGETAAGGRLLHLLQLMGAWDVMVIVTRWYGGVLLGPDRFRLINTAARDALVKAGFGEEKASGKRK